MRRRQGLRAVGDWINRIGWERFFEKTGSVSVMSTLDDYRLAMTTWRTTTSSNSKCALGGAVAVLAMRPPSFDESPPSCCSRNRG